jgi:hypothetical protein
MDMKKSTLLASILVVGLMYGCKSGSDDVVTSGSAVNTDTNITNTDTTTTQKIEPIGWYARTTVTAITPDGKIYKHTTAGVFGELNDSSDAKDRHDIEAIDSGVVQVLFINENLEADKRYYSDYREFNDTQKESWTFVVSNVSGENITDADIKLDVSSIYDVFTKNDRYVEKVSDDQSRLQKLTLIDLDHNQTYSVDDLKTINLSMEGKKTRYFRWVLGEVSDADMKQMITVAVNKSIKKESTDTEHKNSKFGLPPVF